MSGDRIELAGRVVGASDAPPLLLLHGLTGSGEDWDGVAPALAESWRLHIPDLRGHGASPRSREYSFELMRDDVLGYLDDAGLAEVTVIGHSLGGVIAYLLAALAPSRVRAMVLEEPPPPIPLDRPVPSASDAPSPYDRRAVGRIIRQVNAPDPAWRAGLASTPVPALVIGGGPASHLPQDEIAAMAELLPYGTFVTVPAGHGVHAEAPGPFLDQVLPFLARHRPAPAARPAVDAAVDGG
ncbi:MULTISPECIES: alpha/beta fold hydrolase [unclassified Streptomyces]|uniref:alpha/beta fold hydrolase n=1 Tax=unclassified Streptomyces TaxID=2593676 RepID=UPI002E2B06D9|nr:alpha/beta fold hydrolase [Streptomyces sp. NBC_00223]